jgi:hypothetical protein
MSKTANGKQFKVDGQVSRHFMYELNADETMLDVVSPEFWKTLTSKIGQYDVVTCIGGKDSIDVDLRCMGVANGYCIMRIIREAPAIRAGDVGTQNTETHIEYRPGRKWCVIGRDGTERSSGHNDRDAANAAMAAEG